MQWHRSISFVFPLFYYSASDLLVRGDSIMSDSVPLLSPRSSQSKSSVLGPGLVGLFIQGIETGLVFAQISRWFSARNRNESSWVSIVIIFVTIVGLAQSGIYFASAWAVYVQQFSFSSSKGLESVNPLLTLFISVPVQALMLRRCYYILSKNRFIMTLLVLLLVASIAMSLWSIVLLIHILANPGPTWSWHGTSISFPYLMSVLLPLVLDIIITSILLVYLTRTMKQVYAAHKREQISHFAVNIVWQSALPPTLCATCVAVFYIQSSIAHNKKLQYWLPVLQTMTGKLYVLSLLYMINARPLQPDGRSTTVAVSTLTVPAGVNTLTPDTQWGGVACGQISAESSPAKTIAVAV